MKKTVYSIMTTLPLHFTQGIIDFKVKSVYKTSFQKLNYTIGHAR